MGRDDSLLLLVNKKAVTLLAAGSTLRTLGQPALE